ncbi:MAG: sugar-binding protein [Candidatus Latescibacterota bacterium]
MGRMLRLLAVVGLVAVGVQAHSARQIGVRDAWSLPRLDGQRDDSAWRRAVRLDCSPDGPGLSTNQLLESAAEPAGEAGTAADLAADLRLTWDSQGLYVLAEVRDNVRDVSGTGEATYWWERDGISLYLDLDNADDPSAPYTALNIVNVAAVSRSGRPDAVTLEYTAGGGRAATQEAGDLQGIDYAYRDAGTEFGGKADYALEVKIPWETLTRFNLSAVPSVGTVMGLSALIVDPDGDEGFGGQIQCWGMADEPVTYADMVFKGLVRSARAAGGAGPVAKPVAQEANSWARIKAALVDWP